MQIWNSYSKGKNETAINIIHMEWPQIGLELLKDTFIFKKHL